MSVQFPSFICRAYRKTRADTPVRASPGDCYDGMKPVEVANAVIEVAGLG